MQDNKMQDNTMQDNTLQGNPDGFETVQEMGNAMEKSGQLLNSPENGKWSNKIQMLPRFLHLCILLWCVFDIPKCI